MRLLCVLLFVYSGVAGAEPLRNWTAKFAPCHHHGELLRSGPMNLGVRFTTANPILAQEFRAALNFWSKVLDLSWYEDNSENCAVEVGDGARDLFEPEPENMAARSQFPDRLAFQGWIAFNPAVALSKTELYRISVHEFGHMLGLRHNPNIRSLMYSLDMDCADSLDSVDLAALAAHHKLRIASLAQPVSLTSFLSAP